MVKKNDIELAFAIGDRVRYAWGERPYEGVVVSCFLKRDRTSLRYVVENDIGWVQIYKPGQLEHVVRE